MTAPGGVVDCISSDDAQSLAEGGEEMVRSFKVLLQWDSEAQLWVTYVPALDQLSTYGETKVEALDRTREAIAGYLEAAAIEGIPVPTSDDEAELVDVEVAVA
jgi:predicted RNase H-like HicB family nuclease